MKKSYQIIILCTVYMLALGIRVYWLSQKNAFHVDEGMTVAIACYKDYIIAKNFDFDREYTGKEIKEQSLAAKAGIGEALKDIRNLWKDNRDPPHTNLYYTFLRIALIGQKTADIPSIIARGGILNLLFFTISFIFFFLVVKILFPQSMALQCLITLCAFMSTAAVSNTVFLRPYQIQETMYIVLCYCFLITLNAKKYYKIDSNWFVYSGIIPMSFITAITLMTGYYAVIFIGLLGLYVVYIKCREKKYSEIGFYGIIASLGLLLAQALYTRYFAGFSSYRAAETARTVSANAMKNLKESLIAAVEIMHTHFFTYPVIAVCVICLLYLLIRRQKPDYHKQALFILVASIVYIIVTLILAPYKILRYGMPVFPFLVFFPAMLIGSLYKKERTISHAAALLLCISFIPGLLLENRIENLFRHKSDEYIFAQRKDIPVYVYVHTYEEYNYANIWKYANLVPYLHDEQSYYFIKKFNDINVIKSDEYYLVIENFYGLSSIDNLQHEILEEVAITGGEPETPGTIGFYFLCRRMKNKPEGEK